MYKKLAIIFILILAAASFVFAASEPQGSQELELNWSQRNTPYAAISRDALAGNITELKITGKSQTRTWQGYVGNVTGTITLDDASNFTLYDWANAEPRGQIYATPNETVVWSNVTCLDYYNGQKNNLSHMEDVLGLNDTERDGMNETFQYTTHDRVYVGSVQITENTCPTTYLYQDDAVQTTNFQEILLTDNTTDGNIIYTALIEDRLPGVLTDKNGYNGVAYDFQMLVGENGHGTDVATTPYWFYVELI